jgi:hypothetical protein
MKRSSLFAASIVFIFCFSVMTGIAAAAANEITAEQFKEMILLLNKLDHGKTTLVAVQGEKVTDVTEFALMKKISLSGVKTAFYLKDVKSGVKRLIAEYESAQTSKSLSRDFWGKICRGAGLCDSCAQLFGDNPCK